MAGRQLTVLGAALMLLGALSPAHAQARGSQGGKGTWEIDTEHIFGFTEGSDIGKAGEQEAELEPFLRLGKRSGRYFATSTALLYKYSVADDFRVAPSVTVASHDIAGVPGLVDHNQVAFEGVGAEIRYRVLNRERAPFGFTASFEPGWNRIDGTNGDGVGQLSLPLIVLLDRVLIANKLLAAVNLSYDPRWTRLHATGATEREATISLSGALTTEVARDIFFGGEVRYLRKYEGIGLDAFSGDALFAGPTLFAKVSDKWFVSAAWNTQFAGRAAGEPGYLDLTNFERQQVRLRVGVGLD